MSRARAVNVLSLPEATVEEAIKHIARNLREADMAELRASVGGDPEVVLVDSWRVSTAAWLILDDTNLPIGVFGVAPGVAPGVGIAWLMGTDDLAGRAALSVARQTRRYVEELNGLYPVLWNYVDARNELSIRWLEWAGFLITDVHPNHGPEGRTFYEFARITE